MMHLNKFILSVKANNQILRDNDGSVSLPFGQEFSLLCKNINSRRAMVSISIDGTVVTGNQKIIIPANGTVELERYIRDGNMQSGNRFKFIERTAGVEAGRGIKQDDGIVRAEFWGELEAPRQITETVIRQYVDRYPPYRPAPYDRPWPWYWDGLSWCSHQPSYFGGNATLGGLNGGEVSEAMAQDRGGFNQMNANVQYTQSKTSRPSMSTNRRGQISATAMRAPMGSSRARTMRSFVEEERSFNDAGITVPGSESRQQFQNVAGFPLESTSTVIVLQLRGAVGGVAVAAPVTVQHKPTCSTCRKVNKAQNKFCSDCGTALLLL